MCAIVLIEHWHDLNHVLWVLAKQSGDSQAGPVQNNRGREKKMGENDWAIFPIIGAEGCC